MGMYDHEAIAGDLDEFIGETRSDLGQSRIAGELESMGGGHTSPIPLQVLLQDRMPE